MAKVTSKLQVTIPKRIAEEYGIAPGDEIEFLASGASIRVVKSGRSATALTSEQRLALFDQATARQRARKHATRPSARSRDRGWTRESLYNRGRAR